MCLLLMAPALCHAQGKVGYAYDAAGNRTSCTVDTTTVWSLLYHDANEHGDGSSVHYKLQQGKPFVPYGKNAARLNLSLRVPYTSDYGFNYIHYK